MNRALDVMGGETQESQESRERQERPESQEIGRYRLLERLAAGATAEVFDAVRIGSDQRVVLKRMLREHAGDPRFRRLFDDEAQLAAAIDHPTLVRGLDAGETDGRPFLILERVDGRDLRALIGRGAKLDPLLAAQICARVASALAYLHARLGILHRDVSPENILISVEGEVKLADFGVARKLIGALDTPTDVPVGKLDHLSPEQATPGAELTPRSDVFALGTVLYELVFGKPPFAGVSEEETLDKLRRGALELDLTHPLAAILERCLASSPADRYSTAADVERALEAFLELAGAAPKKEDLARFVREKLAAEEAKPARAIDLMALDLLGGTPATRESSFSRPSTALIAAHEETPAPTTARIEIEPNPPIGIFKKLAAKSIPLPWVLVAVLLTAIIAREGDSEPAPIPPAPVAALTLPAAAVAESDPPPAPRSFTFEELELIDSTARPVEERARRRKAEARPGFGAISVTSVPGARVYIDGDFAGITPVLKQRAYVGNHRVVLRSTEGKLLRSYLVYVKKGETVTLKFGGSE